MNLAGFAARLRELADKAEDGLALDCARAGARELLAVMHEVTPVRSGALRGSEHIQSLSGGGTHAVALVGPDIIYDRFRNDGGTIHVKRAKVLSDGVSFFGKSVTQHGAHYMEKAEAEGASVVASAIQGVVEEFLTLE